MMWADRNLTVSSGDSDHSALKDWLWWVPGRRDNPFPGVGGGASAMRVL